VDKEDLTERIFLNASRFTRLHFASLLALVALLSIGAVFAQAELTQNGNLRVNVSGKLSPYALPRTGTAPVSVSVGGKVTTTDSSEPPQLRKLVIEINSHGELDSVGLPICKISAIRTASNGRALGTCGPSLLGEGKFLGTITLPGAAPYVIQGKLLVFNGEEHGKPVLLGHIYSPHPFATSFVITFDVKKTGKGTYGTVLTADLAKSLGTQRNLTGIEMTLDRRYSYKGKRRSYVSAGCPAPNGISKVSYPLARTTFGFADGTELTPVLSRSCRARG
jgi:hypothetical protein